MNSKLIKASVAGAAVVALAADGSTDRPFDVLLDVVGRAARGERVLDEGDRRELLAALRRHRADADSRLSPFRKLTSRERDVLRELAHGKSVECIASEWVVSTATVRSQVRAVLTKLDVRSQLAAVAKAQSAGWSFDR